MIYTEAAELSDFGFAYRNNMLFGGGEQFLLSSDRYYRLEVVNAQCFTDWEAIEDPTQLLIAKRNYPYIVIPEVKPPVLAAAQGQKVQGQKTHGRKKKT